MIYQRGSIIITRIISKPISHPNALGAAALHHTQPFNLHHATSSAGPQLRSKSSKTAKGEIPEIDVLVRSSKQPGEEATISSKNHAERLTVQEAQCHRNQGGRPGHEPSKDPVANPYSAKDPTERISPVSDIVFRKHFIVDKSPNEPNPAEYIPKPRANAELGFVYTNDFDLFRGGVVAVVEFGNPHTANCLSSVTLRKLSRVFADLAKRESLRVVVLTGCKTTTNNPIFSAGADIKEMDALSSAHEAQAFISNVFTACESIRKCPVPVIARIDGGCFGAAIELAACCDFRYGTARSRFSMKEVALGIPSVVQARLLANIIGWQETKKLVLLAQDQTAQHMSKIGFLDGCYRTQTYLDHQIDRIVNVIATNAPKATRAQKSLNRFWEENSLKQGLVQGIDTFAHMWEDGGHEPKEYMRAWLNRSKSAESNRSADEISDKDAEIPEKELEKPTSWNFLKLRTYLEDSKG